MRCVRARGKALLTILVMVTMSRIFGTSRQTRFSFSRSAAARGAFRMTVLAGAALVLTACGGAKDGLWEKDSSGKWGPVNQQKEQESIFGKGGLDLFGGDKKGDGTGGGNGLNVNAYLWRASLDTVGFMPLTSADPFGGVIITDWYTPAETPGERFKVNVFILSRDLRADGIKVSVFRQVRGEAGWADVAVADDVRTQFENAVLTRARQLRMATAE